VRMKNDEINPASFRPANFISSFIIHHS
jgi:hypothetical protein